MRTWFSGRVCSVHGCKHYDCFTDLEPCRALSSLAWAGPAEEVQEESVQTKISTSSMALEGQNQCQKMETVQPPDPAEGQTGTKVAGFYLSLGRSSRTITNGHCLDRCLMLANSKNNIGSSNLSSRCLVLIPPISLSFLSHDHRNAIHKTHSTMMYSEDFTGPRVLFCYDQ